MSDPFLAQILIVPYNFAPKAWAFCNGQLMPISQNTALFSILGTTYGGDGQSTFALPNLQNCTALGAGLGPGLTNRDLGEQGGSAAVTVTAAQMPAHNHALNADSSVSVSGSPLSTEVFGVTKGAKPGAVNVYGPATNLVPLDPSSLTSAGGNGAHENRQPYLGLSFVIALQGIFPSRN